MRGGREENLNSSTFYLQVSYILIMNSLGKKKKSLGQTDLLLNPCSVTSSLCDLGILLNIYKP